MRVHHWHSGMVLIAVGAYAIWWDRKDFSEGLRQTRVRGGGQLRAGTPSLLFDDEVGWTTSNVKDGW